MMGYPSRTIQEIIFWRGERFVIFLVDGVCFDLFYSSQAKDLGILLWIFCFLGKVLAIFIRILATTKCLLSHFLEKVCFIIGNR